MLHVKYMSNKLIVAKSRLYTFMLLRESSFNMTRGGMKILRGGGLRKFLGTQKGGSEKNRGGGYENLYTLNPKGSGGS